MTGSSGSLPPRVGLARVLSAHAARTRWSAKPTQETTSHRTTLNLRRALGHAGLFALLRLLPFALPQAETDAGAALVVGELFGLVFGVAGPILNVDDLAVPSEVDGPVALEVLGAAASCERDEGGEEEGGDGDRCALCRRWLSRAP